MRTIAAFLIVVISTSLFWVLPADAQMIFDDESIKNLYEQPEGVVWVRHYQGLMDDVHDVILSLGNDGKNYKGFLVFQRSKELIQVEGKVNKDTLALEEISKDGQITGHIVGKLGKEKIEADWQNVAKNLSADIVLELIEDKEVQTLFCAENKWVINFNGKVKNYSMEFILQRQNKTEVTGHLYFENQDKTFKLKGQLCDDYTFEVGIWNDRLEKVGVMDANYNEENVMGSIKWDESPFIFYELENKKDVGISCIEYADYSLAFSALYPSLEGNEAFNNYIFDEVKSWLTESRAENLKTIIQQEKNLPESRLANRAYAWFDIVFISDEMVSGYLIGNSWSGNHRQSFNFNLDRNEPVFFEDLFEMTPRFHQFMDEKIGDALTSKPFFEDPDFQRWLFQQDFDIITIKQNGIEFSSTDNLVYGAHQVTISYEELMPYFKPENPLMRILASTNWEDN